MKKTVINSVGAERISLRIDPVSDHLFAGLLKEAVDPDPNQARRGADFSPDKASYELPPKKQQLMQKLLVEEGREQLRLSVIVPRRSSKNRATLKLWSSWNLRIQCKQCHRCVTSGHVYCYCGRTHVDADPNPVVDEQIRRNVKQTFDLPTTLALMLGERTLQRKTMRYLFRTTNKRQCPKLSAMCQKEGIRIHFRHMEEMMCSERLK